MNGQQRVRLDRLERKVRARATNAGKPRDAACVEHPDSLRVRVRNGNYSAFNGYRFTPSDYSELICLEPECRLRIWRSKAKYVNDVPDMTEDEEQRWMRQ